MLRPRGKLLMRAMGLLAAVGMLVGIGLGAWRLSRIGAAMPSSVAVVTLGVDASDGDAEAAAGQLEESLSAVPGVQRVEVRLRGRSLRLAVTGAAAGGGPAWRALVADAVARAQPSLPAGASPPLVHEAPAARRRQVWLVNDSRLAVYEVHERVVATAVPALERQPGARGVTACGQGPLALQVRLDAERLRALGLDPRRALAAVRKLKLLSLMGTPAPDARQGEGPRLQPGSVRVPVLEAVSLADGVALRDVAVVQLGGGPPACLAFTGGTQVVSVTAERDAEAKPLERSALPGTVRALGEPASVEVWAPRADDELAGLLERAARTAGATEVAVELQGFREADATATVLVSPAPVGVGGAALLQALTAVPGVAVRVTRGVPGARLVLRGPEEGALSSAAKAVAAKLPGAVVAAPPSLPEVVPEFDRERLAARGLSTAEVAEALRLALGGVRIGDVTVTLPWPGGGDELLALEVAPGVRLGEVAQLRRTARPAERLRVDGAPAVEVLVPGATLDAVRGALGAVELPVGVHARLELLE